MPAKRTDPPPALTLNGSLLENVDSYKYLGIEINAQLDSNQQWDRVYSLISTIPFLLKQLKRSGLEEQVLINTYKSLVLSHFSYSATVLVSTTDAAKHEMAVFQNRILRIIGVSREDART